MTAQKSITVSNAGTNEVYLRGHPRYDAVRVEFDSANSGSTEVDVNYGVSTNDDPSEVESNGFGSTSVVDSATNIDASAGDPSDGTTALGRTVAVQLIEDDGTANGGAEATIYLHNESDPAENAEAFVSR